MLFAADLYNEGLDLPDIDTVLFLRPTESATIFMQQLGRGLRRTPDKAVLTVLDFVGYHRKEFRFDRKLRALTGLTRTGVERGVKEGFPFLPSGAQIVMDRQSQQIVLENLKAQIASRWRQIVAELLSYGDTDLPTFLEESGVDLSDVLRRGSHSWTQLRREAGLDTPPGSELEEKLLKRVRALLMSMTECEQMLTRACWRTTRRRLESSRLRSNDSRGCCTSCSGPMVEDSRPPKRDSTPCGMNRRRATNCRQWSTSRLTQHDTRRSTFLPRFPTCRSRSTLDTNARRS